jgi:hypothetical protein
VADDVDWVSVPTTGWIPVANSTHRLVDAPRVQRHVDVHLPGQLSTAWQTDEGPAGRQLIHKAVALQIAVEQPVMSTAVGPHRTTEAYGLVPGWLAVIPSQPDVSEPSARGMMLHSGGTNQQS